MRDTQLETRSAAKRRKRFLQFAFGAMVLVATALFIVQGGRPDATRASEEHSLASEATEQLPLMEGSTELETADRVRVEPSDLAVAGDVPAKIEPERRVRGRVVDLMGEGLSNLGVSSTESSRQLGVTDQDGVFDIAIPSECHALVVCHPGYITVGEGLVPSYDSAEHTESVIVACKRVFIRGLVVDDAGQPCSRATLTVRVSRGQLGRLAHHVAATRLSRRELTCRSQSDGQFVLEAAPAGATLFAEAEGFEPDSETIPADGLAWCVLSLSRKTTSRLIRGVVVDADSRNPLEGAWVTVGGRTVRTCERGEFALDLNAPGTVFGKKAPGLQLHAIKAGYFPGSLQLDSSAISMDVTLSLAPGTRSITGVVRYSTGKAVTGAQIGLVNGTTFGLLPVKGGGSIAFADLETVLGRSECTSGVDGSFTLDGLIDKVYQVYAIDPVSLAVGLSTPVRPECPLVSITIDEEDVRTLRGHVLDGAGSGVAGVTVRNGYAASRENPSDMTYRIVFGRETRTAHDGSFELVDVGRQALVLQVRGAEIAPLTEHIAEPGASGVTLVVHRRRQFEVVVNPERGPQKLEVLDRNGQVTDIYLMGGGGAHSVVKSLEVDRTAVITLLDIATQLRVTRQDGSHDLVRIPTENKPIHRISIR